MDKYVTNHSFCTLRTALLPTLSACKAVAFCFDIFVPFNRYRYLSHKKDSYSRLLGKGEGQFQQGIKADKPALTTHGQGQPIAVNDLRLQ